MAEREATVVIKWVSDPAEGKAAYDEIRKYAEANPIGLKFSGAAAGGRAGETATFSGGGSVPIGTGMPEVAGRRNTPANPGEVGITSAVARMHGTGMNPSGGLADWAAGPGPYANFPGTTTTNTYYGDSTRAMNANPYDVAPARRRGNNEAYRVSDYERYYRRALAAGVRNPFSEADFRSPVSRSQAYEELEDWKFERAQNAAGRRLDALNGGGGGGGPPDDPTGPWYDRLRDRSLNYANRVNQQLARERARPDSDFVRGGITQQGVGGFLASQFPSLRGQLGSVFGVYGAVHSAEGIFAGQNAYAMGQAQNLGNYTGAAQASIANDTTRGFVEGVPLFGGFASQAAEFATGSRSYAARTIGLSGIQDAMGQGALGLNASGIASANALSVARAAGRGGLNATLAGLTGQAQSIEANRQTRRDADTAAYRANVVAASQRETAAATAASQGFNLFDTSTYGGLLDRSMRGVAGMSVDAEAERRLQDARGASASARARLGRADAASQEAIQNELRAIEAQKRTAIRDDTQAGMVTSYGTRLSGQAFALGQSGNMPGEIVASARAQFQPGIAAAMLRIQNGDMSIQNFAAIQAGMQGQNQAIATGLTGFAQGVIGQAGGLQASSLNRAFQPFEAQREAARAAYRAATTRVDAAGNVTQIGPDTVAGRIAAATRDDRLANIDQQQRIAHDDASRGLGFEGKSLSRMLARDPVGASAFGIASSGIDQIQQFGRSGFADLAEKARANTLSKLDLTQQNYAYSFGAIEADPRNRSYFGARDSQDPSEVFASISEARRSVNDANPRENADDSGPKGERLSSITATDLQQLIRTAIEQSLPAITTQ